MSSKAASGKEKELLSRSFPRPQSCVSFCVPLAIDFWELARVPN